MRRKSVFLALVLILSLIIAQGQSVLALSDVGNYQVSWIGNSFGGGKPGSSIPDDSNGHFVQQKISDFDVNASGLVFTASDWDEGGKSSGLYKDGETNWITLKQPSSYEGDTYNSWGNAGYASAIDGNYLFLINLPGNLIRYRLTDSSDLNSWVWEKRTVLGGTNEGWIGASARNSKIACINTDGTVKVLDYNGNVTANFHISYGKIKDIAIDVNGNLWILADKTIYKYSSSGSNLNVTITGIDNPVKIAASNETGKNQLIVCDDGPKHQIYFYNIATTPSRVKTFGTQGGITSGTPGNYAPLKFSNLKGCNTDADGNIYVGMGNELCIIQKYSSSSELLWSQYGLHFTDCMSVMPGSDGLEIYGIDQIYTMDYSKSNGQEWALKAYTADTVTNTGDTRTIHDGTSYIRKVNGKRVLYTIGMYAGGYNIYVFDSDTSNIARPAGNVSDGGGWAWWVDSNGDIWHGDAGDQIHKIPFNGFDSSGNPIYGSPITYNRPSMFNEINRLIYQPETDTMYISGCTPSHPQNDWGNAGTTLAKFENWSSGNRNPVWSRLLPVDDTGLLTNCIDVCNNYIFTIACKDIDGKMAPISIFRTSDGEFVGNMSCSGVDIGNPGWTDIPYGIQAFERSNGEYIIITEEDARNKNMLYRWNPDGAPTPTPTATPTPTPTPTSTATPTPSSWVRYEAESGTTNCGIFDDSAASGGKGVGWTGDVGKYVSFNVNVSNAGTHKMRIRYSCDQTASKSVYVNGTHAADKSLPSSGGWDGEFWTTSSDVSINLNAGNNTIKLIKDSHDTYEYDIDYIEVY